MRSYALNRRVIVNEPELRVQTDVNYFPIGKSVNYGVPVSDGAEVIARAVVLHDPACPYSSHTDLKLQVGSSVPMGKLLLGPIFGASIRTSLVIDGCGVLFFYV